jgi:hypothetical protein
MLRRTPHRRFWLEAARRAQEIADMETSRTGRGEIRDVPLPPAGTVESDQSDEQPGTGGW